MPIGTRNRPSQPLAENKLASVSPATAVGRAKGKSTKPSNSRRPGNRYRTRTHASKLPKAALSKAAAKEAPRLKRYAARARALVARCHNCDQDRPSALSDSTAIGISTRTLRYRTVNPRVIPKPGSGLDLLDRVWSLRMVKGYFGLILLSPPALGNLVEDASFVKMNFLGPGPAVKDFLNGKGLDVGKGLLVPPGHFGQTGPEKMVGGDFLAGRRPEKIQVGFGDGAGAPLVHHFVHHRDRRLRQNAEGGIDDLVIRPPR